MNDTEDKFLIVKKDSLFGKVKNFFKNIFGVSNKDDSNKAKTTDDVSKSFDSFIKVDLTQKEEFNKLERDFSSGKIKEKDLTAKQKQMLNEYYDEKIANLKASIKDKEEKLKKLKKAV